MRGALIIKGQFYNPARHSLTLTYLTINSYNLYDDRAKNLILKYKNLYNNKIMRAANVSLPVLFQKLQF